MLWGDKTGKLPGRRTGEAQLGRGREGPAGLLPAETRLRGRGLHSATSAGGPGRSRVWLTRRGHVRRPLGASTVLTERGGHHGAGVRLRQMNPRASRSSVVTLNSQFKRCIGTWIMWAFLLFHTTLQGKDLSVPLRSLVELQYLLRMKS